jgi:hypothetical protein
VPDWYADSAEYWNTKSRDEPAGTSIVIAAPGTLI